MDSNQWARVLSAIGGLLILLGGGLAANVAFAQATVPRARIVEELRLRADSEDFPEVSRVAVGPRGEIAIPIAADYQLRVYDADGKRLATLGGRGSGPGELLTIGAFGWAADTIWISDLQQFRTSFVSPQLRVLRTERFPGGTINGAALKDLTEMFVPMAALDTGVFLGQVRWTPRDERGTAGEEQEALAVRERNGSIRPILRLQTGRNTPWSISTFACCTFAIPFIPRPLYAVAANGQFLAELSVSLPVQREGFYRVTMIRANGDTAFSTLHAYRGEPIPQRVQDSALARVVPAPGHLINVPTDLPERVREEARTRMPKWSAPIETLLLGLDGTVWIGFRPDREGRRYFVLGDGGESIGELLVAPNIRLRQASRTRIWVTETDADGLSDVVRYRVTGLQSGARR